MSYRDPLEAERARVEQLEEELEDARLHVKELEKVRVATEPAKAAAAQEQKGEKSLGIFGTIVVAIGVPILLVYWAGEALFKWIHSRWWLAAIAYSLVAGAAYFCVRR